jgi:hypothetical protein
MSPFADSSYFEIVRTFNQVISRQFGQADQLGAHFGMLYFLLQNEAVISADSDQMLIRISHPGKRGSCPARCHDSDSFNKHVTMNPTS